MLQMKVYEVRDVFSTPLLRCITHILENKRRCRESKCYKHLLQLFRFPNVALRAQIFLRSASVYQAIYKTSNDLRPWS